VGSTVSVVIPCKNEEATLGRCLTALRDQRPAPVRIVVVDNGSTDASPRIAAELADEVLQITGGTVAGLRNAGAALAGEVAVLAFVDADCEVAPGWISAALQGLQDADLVGARMLAGPAASWVARRWAAIESAGAHQGSQVWSGHLAVNRALFDRIGGFDARLGTGEDSDLGLRVRAAGGGVRQVPGMVAVHHGFPETLGAFWRRERWHSRTPGWFGRMSGRSRALVTLTTAWAAVAVPVVVGAGVAVAGVKGSPVWAAAAAAGWVVLTVAAIPALGAVAGGDRRGAPTDDDTDDDVAGCSPVVAGRTALVPVAVTHAVQDGVLLGLWATVRAARLPGELLRGRRARVRAGAGQGR
jgi:hypothetical protein